MVDSGIPWIGDVPEGWGIERNKYIFDNPKELVGAESENTQLLSLTTTGIKQRSKDDVGGKIPESYDTYQYVKRGDLVLCLFDLDCSAVFSGYSSFDGMISPAYKVLKCKPCAYTEFYSYWFQFVFEGRKYKRYSKNVRYSLGFDEFGCLASALPPLPEQKAIAGYLDDACGKIDGLREKVEKQIAALEAYKKSVITEAVTGKIVVRDQGVVVSKRDPKTMKPSGVEWIGDVPEGWGEAPLKYYLDILPGYAFSSSDFDPDNGVRLLRGVNVGVNSLRWDDVVYWSKPIDAQIAPYALNAGDLIFGLDRPWISEGTRVAFVRDKDLPALLLQRVCRIRARTGIELMLVYYWLASKSFEQSLGASTTGISVPHISTLQIEDFKILLPPLPEQKAIAAYLDKKCAAIDATVAKCRKQLENLAEYKKSLIYECVTGKREVTA